jgi:hypothetical protein
MDTALHLRYHSPGYDLLADQVGNLVPEAIPKDYLEVEIEQGLEEDERLYKFISHGKRYKSVVEELAKICESWG